MKCDKAQEFFSDYIENALDRPMVVALESHLSGCDSCRTDVDSLRSMWTVLDQVPQVEPPADFVWRTTTRLQNELLNRKEAERARALPWWKRLTPVQSFSYAAIAALLVVGLMIPMSQIPAQEWNIFSIFKRQQGPQQPQISVQLAGQGGATVTIRPASELTNARVWMGYLTPVDMHLKGREYPATAPQTLSVNEVVTLPVRTGGAKAARFTLYVDNQPFAVKTLLLPGAPVANVSLQDGDAYFALQQVAARTGQAMLVDGGLGHVTVDLTALTPDQALQSILQQTGARSTPQPNGVLFITR